MENKKPNTQALAASLIRLNNISQGKAADRAGLIRQNVSSWQNGHENRLSQASQLRLLASLGVSFGKLNRDLVHQWAVREVEDAALVLGALLDAQERSSAEMWQVHNARYPGCVVLRIPSDKETVFVVMYRPLMTTQPQLINTQSLGCGVDMGEVDIDNATWESWLPPAVLDPASFSAHLTHLIEQFPYPIPPIEGLDDFDDTNHEQPDSAALQRMIEQLAPTSKELDKWNEVLFQAKLNGKDFEEIIKTTRLALGIRFIAR